MSNTEKILYILDLRFPDNPPKRVEVIGKISIGSDENATLSIQGYTLSPTHCLFRVVNGVLSIHNLAPTGATTIDGQDLVQGRMYILDKGDQLTIADIQIIIRTQLQDTHTENKINEEGKSDISTLLALSDPKEEKEEIIQEANEPTNDNDLSLDIETSEDFSLDLNLDEDKTIVVEKSELNLEVDTKEESPEKLTPSIQENAKIEKSELKSRSFPVELDQSTKSEEENEDDEFEEDTSIDDSKFNIKHFITSLTSKLKFKKTKNENHTQNMELDDDKKEHTSVSINKLLGSDTTKGKIKPSPNGAKIPLPGKRKAPDFSKSGIKKSNAALKVPGFFPRFFSIILTIFLAYTLSSYISEDLSLSFLDKINLLTKGFFANYLDISLIRILISYIIIDIISHVLFGTTLPLFVMGVRESSSFVISRIKGIIRSFLGIFTTPIIILDIPLIVRKRGFKEIITASHLQYKNSWMKYLIIFYAPFIIIFTLILPLIPNLSYLSAPKMIERTIKISSRKKKGGSQYIIKATIEEMLINIHGILPKYILIFPEIKKTKKDNQFSLKFINTKTGQSLLLSQIKSYKYGPFIEKAKVNNPTFKTFYPQLSQWSNKSNKLKARKEFPKLIKYIFETNTSKAVSTIKNIGPFLQGPLEMKMMLMDTFMIKGSDQLTYFHLKRNMITHPALYIRSNKIKKLNHDKILLFMNDAIVELKLSYNKSSKKFAKKFPNLILKTITPMFVKLKKNNRIGTGLKNSFKLLSSLETDCSNIKKVELASYEALIKANNIKVEGVDTKVKTLVQEVLENSQNRTLRYMEQIKLGPCTNAVSLREIITRKKVEVPETTLELEAQFPDQVQEMKQENKLKETLNNTDTTLEKSENHGKNN